MEDRIEETLPISGNNLTRDATIHYNYTLKENLDIPAGLTLTVGEGAKLDITNNKLTIKPDGKFKQEKNSIFVYEGKMEDSIIEKLPTDENGNLTRDATIHYNHKLQKILQYQMVLL